ncbi:MAG: ferrochelatase [Propionibacteriaceae bacterium]|jgi:ferrochelatase|nr:ferrochelatase [Propionibacteriaceae bacterium]
MAQKGVVLVALGTPEAPTPKAVKKYLREFLTDRRIVDMNPALWRVLLEAVILPVRSPKSAEKYRTVWREEGSPLAHFTKLQAEGVATRLGPDYRVEYAMRYGDPSVAGVLSTLQSEGIDDITIVPLYPQYSLTTVASVYDAVDDYRAGASPKPKLHRVTSFETEPSYLDAVAKRARQAWSLTNTPDFLAGDKLLYSFHGIPEALVKAGDPYREQCVATAAALDKRLGVPDGGSMLTFQSKFGPAPWLKPATIETVEALGKAGVNRVDVICPGFAADCLETLEEINQLNRATYIAANPHGEFNYIECVNDIPEFLDSLANVALSV